MIQAIWQNTMIAQTKSFETVEGNRYFPVSSLNVQYFQPSVTHSAYPWKGEASYCHVVVRDQINKDAAWYYPRPQQRPATLPAS